MPKIPLEVLTAVLMAAHSYQVRPSIILAIMEVESQFDPYCLGDYVENEPTSFGLMQLNNRVGVGKGYPTDLLLDPAKNVDLGTRYLGYLIKRYPDDLRKVAAGYNKGPGNVDSHGWEFAGVYAIKFVEVQHKYETLDDILAW